MKPHMTRSKTGQWVVLLMQEVIRSHWLAVIRHNGFTGFLVSLLHLSGKRVGLEKPGPV